MNQSPKKEPVKETGTLLLRRTIIVTKIEEFVHLILMDIL